MRPKERAIREPETEKTLDRRQLRQQDRERKEQNPALRL